MVKLVAETVCFKRPNSNKMEEGVMMSIDDRHIIIDSYLNIVLNYSIENYYNNQRTFPCCN